MLFSVFLKFKHQTHELIPRKSSDYFADLCEAIINQQLSDRAGKTVFSRFASLFSAGQITPKAVLVIPDDSVRAIGVSWSKVRFIKGLAETVTNNGLSLANLAEASDAEVVRTLTRVKGIGPWTAEMFLMFSLGREDVFSYGDLGPRRAIQKLYGLKKEPSIRQMNIISRKWSPYRTYACCILWRSLEL